MTTTVIDLLNALRTHLSVFEIPAPCSAHLTTYPGGPQVTMQLARHQLPETTHSLLAWADTLTEVTAEAWRVPSGDSVHLSVTGRLPEGVLIRVYGGVPFTKNGISCDLAPDTSTTVPLAVLREWATPGEVTP
jgi:FtsP/CotA-like multicopper oxidase with cupredoxin domain